MANDSRFYVYDFDQLWPKMTCNFGQLGAHIYILKNTPFIFLSDYFSFSSYYKINISFIPLFMVHLTF